MEGDPRQELIDRFIESVEFLNRQMRIGRIGEWQLLDMTIPQVKALGLLERLGPLRMGNLASFPTRRRLRDDHHCGSSRRKGSG